MDKADAHRSVLFVEGDGPYAGLPSVDVWDEARDARRYAGPHPVVAHPPCTRWGRYWSGGPSVKTPCHMGDDAGCFGAALWAVRTFGGVLEHPEASHAWRWHGLTKPPFQGGWVPADDFGGWTCCVAQGHYGHPSQKMTWLYAVGFSSRSLPDLQWGRARGLQRLDEGFHSKEERKVSRASGSTPRRRLTYKQRLHTPTDFRDVLIGMARNVSPALVGRQ